LNTSIYNLFLTTLKLIGDSESFKHFHTMFLFTLNFFHNSFHFMNIFSLCYYFISHEIYTTIYFLNTYKSYDLFLSKPSLIHIINHCVIMSNSHRHLIHNICNSSCFFVSLAFIKSMIHGTSVHTTPLLYWEISSIHYSFHIFHVHFYYL
jgi:hypothetical protein